MRPEGRASQHCGSFFGITQRASSLKHTFTQSWLQKSYCWKAVGVWAVNHVCGQISFILNSLGQDGCNHRETKQDLGEEHRGARHRALLVRCLPYKIGLGVGSRFLGKPGPASKILMLKRWRQMRLWRPLASQLSLINHLQSQWKKMSKETRWPGPGMRLYNWRHHTLRSIVTWRVKLRRTVNRSLTLLESRKLQGAAWGDVLTGGKVACVLLG